MKNSFNGYKDIYSNYYNLLNYLSEILQMSRFTFEQLIDLSFSNKLAYVLPEDIKTLLIDLEACLEITDATINDTPDRREHKHAESSSGQVKHYRNRYDLDGGDRGKKRELKNGKTSSAEWRTSSSTTAAASLSKDDGTDWELMRSFKATKIESKTGIEKTVNDIRIALNKMSASNYDKQRNVVIDLVNGYFAEEVTEEHTSRISKAIFDIASTNKFYSEIYAKLYKELVAAHSVFRDLLETFVNGFTCMDSAPIYIDPDLDYDGFCVYSKACEVRKSTSAFLVNCLKMQLIDSSRISYILFEFLKYVDTKRADSNAVKSVEEIVENIYIIATVCSGELSNTDDWREYVLPTIKRIIAEKNSGLSGLSNRANFKLMDLLEKI